jgi:signal transduction histidine kinase
MDADERASIIHDLKIRLTSIAGYAQMVERQAVREGNASFKQRMYISKLRRLINDLAVAIHEYEQETRQPSTPTLGNDGSDAPSVDIRTLHDCPEQ